MEQALIKAICEYVKANHEEPKHDLVGHSATQVAEYFKTLMNERIIVIQPSGSALTVSGHNYCFKLEVSEHRLKEKYGITL